MKISARDDDMASALEKVKTLIQSQLEIVVRINDVVLFISVPKCVTFN